MGGIAGKIMPRPRGSYNVSEIYNILDMVAHDNKLWMAKKSGLQGISPATETDENWMLCIDSKGNDFLALETSIDERFSAVTEELNSLKEADNTNNEENAAKFDQVNQKASELQASITENANQITALQNGKADKPVSINASITAANWTGDGAPYTNTIAVEGVTETSVIDIVLPDSLTSEHITAYQEAQIFNGSQAEGSITLNCWGIVPLIDLPVIVIIRG